VCETVRRSSHRAASASHVLNGVLKGARWDVVCLNAHKHARDTDDGNQGCLEPARITDILAPIRKIAVLAAAKTPDIFALMIRLLDLPGSLLCEALRMLEAPAQGLTWRRWPELCLASPLGFGPRGFRRTTAAARLGFNTHKAASVSDALSSDGNNQCFATRARTQQRASRRRGDH